MNASKWTQVRIRNDVYSQIEQAVKSIKRRGIEKFDSVPQFVEKACVDLLEKELEKEVCCKH